MAETIREQNVLDAYCEDMVISAITTNRRQNVPDVKDGCKVVVRRIIYDMFDRRWFHDKKYNKCAGVVGNTLERFHPHGDSSVYDTMTLLVNNWDIKYPLIDGHGNYGNMQGEGAAHYRYTECRLTEFAEDCLLGELLRSRDVVDWDPNFNESEDEPRYFPAAVPMLLINGVLGIGVGMKTEIPRHNLGEVLDATIALMHNPNAQVVLIPDHCMPVEIIDTNWKAISNAGNGKYRARGIIDIEQHGDSYSLIIKSVPDRTTLSNKKGEGIIPSIWDMVKEGKLPQIKDIYDDTSKTNLRYVIELKKGSDPQYVRDYIYKHTLMTKSYSINFEVIDGVNPVNFSYKSYLLFFIEFQKMIKYRTYSSLYQMDLTKLTETQLYLKVMQSKEIDSIVQDIRRMKNVSAEARNEFRENLIKKYKVSDLEANFIMKMDITKLAPGYIPIFEKEAAQYKANVDHYSNMILNDELTEQEIEQQLLAIKAKYNKPRLCKVVKAKDENDIPQGEFRIVVTENNYIKKIGISDNINTFRGDSPKFTMIADNRENVLLFDKKGKVFKQPVHKIPLCDKNSAGTDIRLLNKNCTSDIISVIYEPGIIDMAKNIKNKGFLVVVTEKNCIKKMGLDDFTGVAPSGTTYTKLSENDTVIDIAIVQGDMDMIIYSAHKALRVNIADIPHYKRTALGVAAMNTEDTIDGLSILYPGTTHIVVTTRSGKMNKFDVAGLAKSARNRSGSSVIKLGKQDDIVSIRGVNDNTVLKVITATTQNDIPVAGLAIGSSVSTGSSVSKEAVIKVTQLQA